MSDHAAFPSLPDMLDEMPPPDEVITDGRAYLREEAPGEFVVQGVGYLPVMDKIWGTFWLCGVGDRGQEDCRAWGERCLAQAGEDDFSPALVAAMSRNDCHYLLRTIQRSERFCDGAWKAAYRAGLFHAIAKRLIELAGGDKRPTGEQRSRS